MTDTYMQNWIEYKTRKGVRLKPFDEGFNQGLKDSLEIVQKYKGKGYQVTMNALRKKRIDLPTNREDGYNNAILCVMSKLKELQGGAE